MTTNNAIETKKRTKKQTVPVHYKKLREAWAHLPNAEFASRLGLISGSSIGVYDKSPTIPAQIEMLSKYIYLEMMGSKKVKLQTIQLVMLEVDETRWGFIKQLCENSNIPFHVMKTISKDGE